MIVAVGGYHNAYEFAGEQRDSDTAELKNQGIRPRNSEDTVGEILLNITRCHWKHNIAETVGLYFQATLANRY